MDGEKLQDSRHVLKVEPERFVNMLDMEWDGKREADDDKLWLELCILRWGTG